MSLGTYCQPYLEVGEYLLQQINLIKLEIIPSVILLNNIPDSVDDSWYRGKPSVLLKITALSPSTALRNAREVADMLIKHHGSKEAVPPVLIYTQTGVQNIRQILSVLKLQ